MIREAFTVVVGIDQAGRPRRAMSVRAGETVRCPACGTTLEAQGGPPGKSSLIHPAGTDCDEKRALAAAGRAAMAHAVTAAAKGGPPIELLRRCCPTWPKRRSSDCQRLERQQLVGAGDAVVLGSSEGEPDFAVARLGEVVFAAKVVSSRDELEADKSMLEVLDQFENWIVVEASDLIAGTAVVPILSSLGMSPVFVCEACRDNGSSKHEAVQSTVAKVEARTVESAPSHQGTSEATPSESVQIQILESVVQVGDKILCDGDFEHIKHTDKGYLCQPCGCVEPYDSQDLDAWWAVHRDHGPWPLQSKARPGGLDNA